MTAEKSRTPQKSAAANRAKDDEATMPPIAFAEGKSAADYEPGNYKEGSEYPEGDATKGKPDLANPVEIPMRDHRAYLLDQAEKNQRANDELNAMQVEQNRRFNQTNLLLADPDYQRDTSMESAIAEINRHTVGSEFDMHSPEAREKRKQSRAAIQQSADHPADAPGNNRTVQGTPAPGYVAPA
jgi:hypothetical protein